MEFSNSIRHKESKQMIAAPKEIYIKKYTLKIKWYMNQLKENRVQRDSSDKKDAATDVFTDLIFLLISCHKNIYYRLL